MSYTANRLDLEYVADFLDYSEADLLLNELTAELDWRQDEIKLYGKTHPIPRLQCFVADTGISYRYSNLSLVGTGFPTTLQNLKSKIEENTGSHFNAVLANLYRDGKDHMGWHSDDEPELGLNPIIASLSLGASRTFQLRSKDSKKERVDIELAHGSLLIMGPTLQQHWEHALPKRMRITEPRINLTFRLIDEQ